MSAIATLPVAVSGEARAWIQARHRQGELDHILEHVQQTLPEGRHVDVRLAYDPEHPAEAPMVVIRAFRTDPGSPDHTTQHAWDEWILRTFGTDRDFPFVLILAYEANHGG